MEETSVKNAEEIALEKLEEIYQFWCSDLQKLVKQENVSSRRMGRYIENNVIG